MLRGLVIICALALAGAAQAASPRDSLLVDSNWLAAHLSDKNLVVLHSGTPADYQAGHVPGARLVAQGGLAAAPAPDALVLELPSPEDLRKQLQDLGVSDNSRVVVYVGKDQVPAATRILFTFDAAGLGDRVSLLDGGLAEWTRTGHAVSTETPAVTPGKLSPLKMKSAAVVDADFVKTHLKSPGFAVVDARAPVFYDGTQPGGAQGVNPKKGHIPGAKSVPFTTITGPDQKVKSGDQLAASFKAAGVQPGDEVIVYCHVGQQATAVLYAAKLLGMKAVLYDGSFQDWSKRDLPVETPAAAPAK